MILHNLFLFFITFHAILAGPANENAAQKDGQNANVTGVQPTAQPDIHIKAPAVKDPFDFDILLVICSNITSFDRREKYRMFWNSLRLSTSKKPRIHLKFWVRVNSATEKMQLSDEEKRFQDMHIYVVDKNAITSRLFRYALGFSHVTFDYLMKIEDDAFVHVDHVLNYLYLKPRENFFTSSKEIGKTKEDLVHNFDGIVPYIASRDIVNTASVPIFNLSNFKTIQEPLLQIVECDPLRILATDSISTERFAHMANMYITRRDHLCSDMTANTFTTWLLFFFIFATIIGIGLAIVVRRNEKVNCIPISRKDMVTNPLGRIFSGTGIKKAH